MLSNAKNVSKTVALTLYWHNKLKWLKKKKYISSHEYSFRKLRTQNLFPPSMRAQAHVPSRYTPPRKHTDQNINPTATTIKS